jgi:cathepsin A (carboxypeptidase C)
MPRFVALYFTMKALSILSLVSLAVTTLAIPLGDQQIPLGNFYQGLSGHEDLTGNVLDQITNAAQHLLHDAETIVINGKNNVKKWFDDGREFILQNGLVCECLNHSE